MKKAIIVFILGMPFLSNSQTIQNVNKTNGTSPSNNISTIDSIIFPAGGGQMQINLNNAAPVIHQLQDIVNVNFFIGGVYPAGTVFCNGTPTVIVDVTNPTTGEIWMDRNLGATQAATSSTDANSYGDLYQWGRRSDGHQCRTSATTPTLSSTDQPANGSFITVNSGNYDWRSPQNNNLWQGVNGVNNPCPSGYRLPTEAELIAEYQSWAQQNSAGAFASALKLPMAGLRDLSNGSLLDVGTSGYYWSSTVSSTDSRSLFFFSSDAYMSTNFRASGSSVRCLKDVTSPQGYINTIDCGSATNNGTLTSGTAASGVSSLVTYSGGNGGTHSGQTVTSTGVTGLTATLAAGTFANGTGSLTYTITGTPSSSSTASFVLSIGGQSCTLSINVLTASSPAYSPNSVFCANGPTSVVDVTNPATGEIWMDRNLGATQAATSSTDANSYGDLYQWGRRSDGHQCRTSATTTTLSSTDQPANGSFIIAPNSPSDWRSPQNNNLWLGVNGVNNPCPSGYRLPTEAELVTERLSWSSNNAQGAFASALKLPVAGSRDNSNGSLGNVGTFGLYWSSTVGGVGSRRLVFGSSNAFVNDNDRAYGYSVRCLKDVTSPQGSINTIDCGSATNNGTLTSGTAASGVNSVVPYTGGNGVAYNGQTVTSTGVTGLTATLTAGTFANGAGSLTYTITGTPSASGTASFALSIGGQSCNLNLTVNNAGGSGTYPPNSVFCSGTPTVIVDVTNPATGRIWMDRNLGATQAATSSTDANSYGDLYQWGRRSDGHQCRTSPTLSTLSSSDQPSHGSFILAPNSPYNWRSPQNNNLWQGVNGVNNPCPSGYRLPTEAELIAEYQSWAQQNSAGAFASALKLPMAGYRLSSNGSLILVGTFGVYWSSTVSSIYSRRLYFDSSLAGMTTDKRALGFSVRCLKDVTSPQGYINTIDCGSATNNGTLTSGTAASGVSSLVPYTGGNGGTHNGQTANSTGVSGLTATLAAGTFANGTGSLTYTITGTPSASGTASFALSIGGQSCNLNLTVSIANGSGTYPPNSVFCSGTPTVIVDVTNPTTGEIWMDRNLGATQVATSSTDTNSYGDLYQWGRRSDGHQCRTSATTTTLSSTDQPANGSFILAPSFPNDWRSPQNYNLWQGVNGVNNPCPSGYRLPTEAELVAERLSWSTNNAAGAFASALKLPLAGLRDLSNGSLGGDGTYGYYWSSTVPGFSSQNLNFFSSDAFMNSYPRAFGSSVRCLKDVTSPQGSINTIDCGSATNNGTLTSGTAASGVSSLVTYSGGNGGTHSGQTVTSTGVTDLTATLSAGTFANGAGSLTYTITGTPSASGTASFALSIGGQSCNLSLTVNNANGSGTYPPNSVFCSGTPTVIVDVTNPTTGEIWMDRNLGATQVATSSTDTNSYGDLYQWGRRSDGHQCRTSATTTTLSSTDQPANATFILAPNSPEDWRSPQNDNLWQGVNGVNNPCPSGYRLPTEAELNAERLSWSSNNAQGAFASALKLPLAGFRFYSFGGLFDVGATGYYWSSSVNGVFSQGLLFSSGTAGDYYDFRATGLPVRCLKD